MRRIRFRLMLPIVLGFLSLTLFAWQHENNRVIESMGMGWDTGPPMWPYRAVPSFSYALNAPVYIACWPLIKLINPQANWVPFAIWFPAITVLWWWVGTRIDFGLLGRRSYLHPKPVGALLLAGALILLALSVKLGVDEYCWYKLYWSGHPPVSRFCSSGLSGRCSGVCCSLALQSRLRCTFGVVQYRPENYLKSR